MVHAYTYIYVIIRSVHDWMFHHAVHVVHVTMNLLAKIASGLNGYRI